MADSLKENSARMSNLPNLIVIYMIVLSTLLCLMLTYLVVAIAITIFVYYTEPTGINLLVGAFWPVWTFTGLFR
jgi:uncharacterized membrane protein